MKGLIINSLYGIQFFNPIVQFKMSNPKIPWHQKFITLIFLVSSLNAAFSSPCQDEAYLKLKQAPLNTLEKADILLYLKLDSLCNSETKVLVPSDKANIRQPSRVLKPRRSKQPGTALSWVTIGVGSTLFLLGSLLHSSISDDCNPFFTLNLFKTQEECKAEADAQRSDMAKVMTTGGIMTVAGIVGLIAVNSAPNPLPDSAEYQSKPLSVRNTDCEEIENRVEQFKCFRNQRLQINAKIQPNLESQIDSTSEKNLK